MARFRKPRLSTYKNPIKHSSTTVSNIGSGKVPTTHSVYFTNIGLRSGSGVIQTIKDIAKTDGTCNVGDIIKYINVCIQCGPRNLNLEDNCGWLEWAVVRQVEQTQLMALTNLGVQSLQSNAQHEFRNNVMLTGCFPLGTNQANSVDLKLKIPKQWEKLKIGAILTVFCYFRSVDSTDVRTDSHRIVVSSIFKAYS